MFKQDSTFIHCMNLDNILKAKFSSAVEINATFDDKKYLENIFNNLLGKEITGYAIIENETAYLWNEKVEKRKNYCASTIVNAEQATIIASYFYGEIKKKWETPLIQVRPCFVNSGFYQYLLKRVVDKFEGTTIPQNFEVGS